MSIFFELVNKIRSSYLNLIGLFLIQGANAVFPIIVLPYAFSVITNKNFTLIAVSESLILIHLCFVLYSYDIEGVKWLSVVEANDNDRRSYLFSLVLWARLAILITTIPILILFVIFYDKALLLATLAWLPLVFGHVLYSAWFFQVNEDNLRLGLFSALLKTAAACLLLVLIKSGYSYIYIPLGISCSYLLAGVMALQIAKNIHGIRLRKMSPRVIFEQFRSGRHIFLGNISVLLFRGTNTLILHRFSSEAVVAIYALAEKIIKALQAAIRPINQLIHTKLIKHVSIEKKIDNKNFSLKYIKLQAALILVAFFIVVLAYLVKLYYDDVPYSESKLWVSILFMWPAIFFGTVNFIFGNAGLNAMNQDKAFSRAVLSSGIVSIGLSILLIHSFSLWGAVAAYVLGEALLSCFVLYLQFHNKNT